MNSLLLCKHCGNKTSHLVLNEVIDKESMFIEEYGEIEFELTRLFTKCNNCRNYSLYVLFDNDYDTANAIYPYEYELGESVPKEISNAYNEALKVKKISKLAFIILIRRALDLVAKEQNANGKTLATKIIDLGKKGIIPEKISKMADLIRLLGNESVHEKDFEFEDSDLKILDDFFVAIVDYIYCIHIKIERIQDKLNK